MMKRATKTMVACGLCVLLPAALAAATPALEEAADLMVVDCLLRAKIRRIGRHSSYLSPRLPVRTTAADCRIRAGEYTEPDAANYATSLRVWLPEAEAGNTEAMFYVGQIYEKGLGVEPEYAAAVTWYQRAAEHGYTPAMVNLAYLYEVGLGVAPDRARALSYYRRAAGGLDDLVVMAETDWQRVQDELRLRNDEAAALRGEVAVVSARVAELVRAAGDRADARRAEIDALRGELEDKQQRLAEAEATIARLATQRDTNDAPAPTVAEVPHPAGIDFGRYRALVIGNSRYQSLPPLANAAADARRVASVLEQAYGYRVELLLDATRFDIMKALNRLREELNEKDNLLVFYLGHGTKDANRNAAYWQPVDAAPDQPENWISSGVLADHLDLIPAKHVMVVADSAFSGLRTRSSIARLPQGQSEERRYHYIRQLLDRRARLVLASGAAPAASGSFTNAFLTALESNQDVLEASRLHARMRETLGASGAGGTVPELATLRFARNDLSEFFFVRKR